MSEDIKFRKTKNNQTIAIKEGEVVGGAGTSVGPDNLPSFSSYEGNFPSFSKKAKSYVETNLVPVITKLRFPKGMPSDCEKILMTRTSIAELVSKLNNDKVIALPFLAQVYREGKYGEARDTKHPDIDAIVYTTAKIKVSDGKELLVQVQTKRRKGNREYFHYGIAKADPIEKKTGDSEPYPKPNRQNSNHPSSRNPLGFRSTLNESQNPVAGRGVLRPSDIVAHDEKGSKAEYEFIDFEVEEMPHDRLEFGIAWDGMASVREVDDNGFLHVKKSPLTRVQVAPYRGKEIPTWEKLGFDPEKIYYAYRPAEELEKYETINSVNGIPIHLLHHDDEGREEDKETRIGSTGTDARFFYPFLWNSLHIYDKKAQDRINDGSMKELSLGYSYEVDPTSGETDTGEHYDFVMRNIRANHLALVEAGRAGPRVKVLDTSSNLTKGNAMDKEEKVQDQSEEVEAKADKTEAMDEDKDAEIKRLTEQVAEYLSPEELEKFKNSLTDLAYSKATGDDGEEVAEVEEKEVTVEDDDPELDEKFKNPDFKDGFEAGVRYGEKREKLDPKRIDRDHEREGEERYLESHDDDKLVEDALKACGLDGADEEEKKAFAAGLRFADKKHDAEDEDCEKAKASDTIERVRKAITAEMRAIEETSPILGKTRLGAYDSAGAIYASALSKVGIRGVAKDHARSAFRAYMQGRGQSTRTEAKDSAESFQPTGLTKILTKVGI